MFLESWHDIWGYFVKQAQSKHTGQLNKYPAIVFTISKMWLTEYLFAWITWAIELWSVIKLPEYWNWRGFDILWKDRIVTLNIMRSNIAWLSYNSTVIKMGFSQTMTLLYVRHHVPGRSNTLTEISQNLVCLWYMYIFWLTNSPEFWTGHGSISAML